MKKHLVPPEFLCVLIFATLQCFRSLQTSILDKDNLSGLSGQWRPAIFQKHHLAYKRATKRVRCFRIYTEANLLVYTGDLSVLCQPGRRKWRWLTYLFTPTASLTHSSWMRMDGWTVAHLLHQEGGCWQILDSEGAPHHGGNTCGEDSAISSNLTLTNTVALKSNKIRFHWCVYFTDVK